MTAEQSPLLELLQRLRQQVLAGGRAAGVEVLGAVGLVTFAGEARQAACWDAFRALAAAYLRQGADNATAALRFLAETGIDAVAHFRRNDPQLWDVAFHVVRTDGSWLVCTGRFNELVFLTGDAAGNVEAVAGPADGETARRAITAVKDAIAAGYHVTGGGRQPPLHTVFNNSRPIDQSLTIARCARLLADGPVPPRLTLHQNRISAFFDPAVFPAIARCGGAKAYAAPAFDPRREAERGGGSLIEAFYLPDQSWTEQHAALHTLRQYLKPVANPPSDGRLRVFVSLEFEKRVWTEQVEALLALLQAMGGRGVPLDVMLNGMTGVIHPAESHRLMQHYSEVTSREAAVLDAWRAALPAGTGFHHLAGLDMGKKIAAIASCATFAAPAGTAALLALLAEVPGVYYGHPGLQAHFSRMLAGFPEGRLICRDAARPDRGTAGVIAYGWAGVGGESYSIPVADFLAEALAALPPPLAGTTPPS